MEKTITVFEHDCTVGFGWTHRDVHAIEKLNRAAGAEMLRPIVRSGERELRATQHVGVFRIGSRTVQVLPKIYKSVDATDPPRRAREATGNLLHLLREAGNVPVAERGVAALLQRGMDWLEILTYLFASHLREEWKRGASRGYVVVEDDLPTLKGRWRIGEQLRRSGRDHLFAVSHDEFTPDTALNRIFRFVVERLWTVTRDDGNRHRLGELRHWLDEVTLVSGVSARDAQATLLNRMNRHLEPLLNLARLFLDGSAMQLATGDTNHFAFSFDMNRVFEAFVVNFLCRHRREILPPDMWECDLLPQALGASLCLARAGEVDVFRLKPDLALRSRTGYRLVADAKYKKLEPEAAGSGVAPADFNQMFAYAHRYDCPRAVMLYPQTADVPIPVLREFTLEGTAGKTVVVATLDIRQDLGTAEARRALADGLRRVFQPRGAQS